MSSLPQEEFEMDTEKQRQRRCNDVRLIKSRNARSEQLLVVRIQNRVAYQQRMAARRALEWIRTSKARLIIYYGNWRAKGHVMWILTNQQAAW